MTVNEFNKLLQKKIFILDGATGTELQKKGMPKGVCPEQWIIENEEILIELQKNYIKSGSDAVFAPTFGSNRFKLEEFGFQDKVTEMNKKLVEISKKAVGSGKYVAGDLAPTGKFVEPFGDVKFEDAVNVYKEQVKALIDAGVDFFIIETMLDIQETRAALIAVKETTDLPVIASMTYSPDGRTLMGTEAISALITLQSLGANAVGCNCSTGPGEMLELIKKMKPYATVPLFAKPNAGLPKLIDGQTIFEMGAVEFGKYFEKFAEAGVNLFGGCCGTTPDHIKAVTKNVNKFVPILPLVDSISAVSSARGYRLLPYDKSFHIIGERINPTGKKKLQKELLEGKLDEVRRFAVEQNSTGASLLDVNMGMSGIDEKAMMLESIKLLSTISDLPLSIDSSDPDVIESALRLYPGRALVNSISGEKKKITKLLPIIAKYGAMFILLPLNDKEIPKTAEGRIKIVHTIFDKAKEFGINKNDIVIDGLVMTVSADQEAAKETLKLIKWATEEFNVNTTVGLSNVSFGLPQRKWINSAFLSMAVYAGLSTAISNPSAEIFRNIKYASEVLVGKDVGSTKYINYFASVTPNVGIKKSNEKESDKDILSQIYDCVIDGNKEKIDSLINVALQDKNEPSSIVNDRLIPAINKVGDLYDKKIYFLPQLIASAETMKKAFAILEPLLRKDESKSEKKVKIILATVKGDIHDIGKNIVGLMFKNYGFDVIDLGKDVPSEDIIQAAKKENADIIGLSALMTTTMVEMKTVVDLAKKNNLDSKIIIGGAVTTPSYADEIGANGHSSDSISAVKLVKKLLNL